MHHGEPVGDGEHVYHGAAVIRDLLKDGRVGGVSVFFEVELVIENFIVHRSLNNTKVRHIQLHRLLKQLPLRHLNILILRQRIIEEPLSFLQQPDGQSRPEILRILFSPLLSFLHSLLNIQYRPFLFRRFGVFLRRR